MKKHFQRYLHKLEKSAQLQSQQKNMKIENR